MSARSETLEGIDPEGRAWLASHLDVFAKRYAHELAEKIRQSEGSPPVHATQASKATYRWHALRSARLIDPEVTE